MSQNRGANLHSVSAETRQQLADGYLFFDWLLSQQNKLSRSRALRDTFILFRATSSYSLVSLSFLQLDFCCVNLLHR